MRHVLKVARGVTGAAFLALVACSLGPDAPVPVVVFPSSSIDDVRDRLAARCLRGGSDVTESGPNRLVCSKDPTSGAGSVGGAALRVLGGGDLVQVVAFSFARQGGDVVVQGRSWLESRGSFGQVRQSEDTDAAARGHLLRVMQDEANRSRAK
jgi:hypothetical protein